MQKSEDRKDLFYINGIAWILMVVIPFGNR